jgi:hypothetical protein
MTPELDEKLCKEFPNLYADRHASMMSTAMCWGFECCDGWFQLLYDLSQKLEELILKMPEDERSAIRASQVKEKYGTLRFYMTLETDEMYKAIQEAEKLSARTCEECGEPGKTYVFNSWYYTRCEECFSKIRERFNNE